MQVAVVVCRTTRCKGKDDECSCSIKQIIFIFLISTTVRLSDAVFLSMRIGGRRGT